MYIKLLYIWLSLKSIYLTHGERQAAESLRFLMLAYSQGEINDWLHVSMHGWLL